MKNISPLDLSGFPEVAAPMRVLLGPGPSMVDPRVLRMMSSPVVGHMDPTYLALMGKIQELLRYTFQAENPLTLSMAGTGSAAMETAVANMIRPGDSVLVCAAGYFGLRIADMAARYGAQVRTLTKRWGDVISPGEVRDALRDTPARVVAIVHGETSSGVLQPVQKIADVVHQQGGLLIVDTVASLGGVPFYADDWEIDVCYSGSQKCLSCPPGQGPITLGPRAVEALAQREGPVPNWYLDLNMVRRYWDSEHAYHHTGPISSSYALYEALRLLAAEGLEASWERHQRNAELLWDGLASIGLQCHVPREHRLPTVTTVCVPDGVDEAGIRRRLLQEYNIEIAGGLGELKGKVWRVGLMGYSSRKENVILLIEALRRLLKA